MRKDAQFEITDRIDVVIEENDDLKKAVDTFKEHIASQVLANSLVIGDAGEGSEQDFGKFKAKIFIKKN
jgi:isoleucyl-tRNA synthetase